MHLYSWEEHWHHSSVRFAFAFTNFCQGTFTFTLNLGGSEMKIFDLIWNGIKIFSNICKYLNLWMSSDSKLSIELSIYSCRSVTEINSLCLNSASASVDFTFWIRDGKCVFSGFVALTDWCRCTVWVGTLREWSATCFNIVSSFSGCCTLRVEMSLTAAAVSVYCTVFHVEEKWETKAVESFKGSGWHLALSIFKDQALFCSSSFCV